MNFKEEHIPVLEQHRHHWTGLRDVQVMRNLDRPVIDSLQKIYNEAIGLQQFTPWCSECVADLVRLLYTQFEKWENQQPKVNVTLVAEGAPEELLNGLKSHFEKMEGEQPKAENDTKAPAGSKPNEGNNRKGAGGRKSKSKPDGN